MKNIEDKLNQIQENPQNVRFRDLCEICDYYFGPPRIQKGSHRVYKMPWTGDPRVNIQNQKGMTKTYQVRQVLKAIEKMEIKNDINR
ncbi:MAG: toxin HicA [Candidatus Aminicenantes bacterium]|nr:toxin HicA [Candidatus Aminicenantes bacterium]